MARTGEQNASQRSQERTRQKQNQNELQRAGETYLRQEVREHKNRVVENDSSKLLSEKLVMPNHEARVVEDVAYGNRGDAVEVAAEVNWFRRHALEPAKREESQTCKQGEKGMAYGHDAVGALADAKLVVGQLNIALTCCRHSACLFRSARPSSSRRSFW